MWGKCARCGLADSKFSHQHRQRELASDNYVSVPVIIDKLTAIALSAQQPPTVALRESAPIAPRRDDSTTRRLAEHRQNQ